MSNFADELKKDAEQSKQVKSNTMSLQEVKDLCAEMARQEAIVKELEDDLEEAKESYEKYSEEIIPDALVQIGLKGLDLDDGTWIGLAETVAASITEEKKGKAHAWLRANELGDLIKNEVIFRFGKDEDTDADSLISAIKKMDDINYGELERKEAVHAQTLKAFVKQRVKEGKKIPMDLFGIFLGTKAVVERKKNK